MGRMAHPPPAQVLMDGHRPPPGRAHRHRRPPLPSPPPPCRALHSTAHGKPQMHQEVVERARLPPRMPTRIRVMSDSDGSPRRDDRHHHRPRSRSPVSPECAGESLAEREERQLAGAAVLVGPPTRSRRPGDLRRPRRPPPPPRRRALPPRPRRGPQAHRGPRPQPQQAALRPRPRPPARRQRGG